MIKYIKNSFNNYFFNFFEKRIRNSKIYIIKHILNYIIFTLLIPYFYSNGFECCINETNINLINIITSVVSLYCLYRLRIVFNKKQAEEEKQNSSICSNCKNDSNMDKENIESEVLVLKDYDTEIFYTTLGGFLCFLIHSLLSSKN